METTANIKTKYYKPPNLIFQHLPVKGKVENIEVNRVRNGYIADDLTSVDIQQIVKTCSKFIEIYGAVIYQEKF